MHCTSYSQALSFLSSYPGLGPKKLRQWISLVGSPEELALFPREQLARLPNASSSWIEKWPDPNYVSRWEKDWEWILSNHILVCSENNPSYPPLLRSIQEPPLILYAQGNITLLTTKSLAVIGTRNPTHYGREMATRLANDLAKGGFTIISGLARGIDTAAHQGALHSGTTIAILGSGLKNIYPKENQHFATIVAQQGCLISPFLPSAPPERFHFPLRNHIVSGLASHGIVLVEAPEKSGAMLTMRIGQKQGKKLFALPGRADTNHFRGNHILIKKGEAQLIEKAADVFTTYDLLFPLSPPSHKAGPILSQEEEKFLATLPETEMSVEELIASIPIPVAKIQVLLMGLVMKKYLTELPGKMVRKTALAGDIQYRRKSR